MRSTLSISALLALLLPSGCGVHAAKQDTSRQAETHFRDYKVIISESDGSRVEIPKGVNLVYAMGGGRFFVGNLAANENKEMATPIGMDIAREGQPNLVVSAYTGGAHCCSTFLIFETKKICYI